MLPRADMVRVAANDDTGETIHAAWCAAQPGEVFAKFSQTSTRVWRFRPETLFRDNCNA